MADLLHAYTTLDIATMCDVCEETVCRWIRSGKIHARMSGGRYWVSQGEFERFVKDTPKYANVVQKKADIAMTKAQRSLSHLIDAVNALSRQSRAVVKELNTLTVMLRNLEEDISKEDFQ